MNAKPPLQTDRDWLIVVNDVSDTAATLWIGTLSTASFHPGAGRLRFRAEGQPWREIPVHPDWTPPVSKSEDRYCQTIQLDQLQPGTRYYGELILEHPVHSLQQAGQCEFKTLPERIGGADDPFTLLIGSCYHQRGDDDQVARTFQALWDDDDLPTPDLTVLAGDQVYLDVGWGPLLARGESGIRRHILECYERHWRSLQPVLSRGATWMMSDDHELWNDYPDLSWTNPLLLRFHFGQFKSRWEKTALEAIERIQNGREIRTRDIGSDLSIMTLDARLGRTSDRLFRDSVLDQALDWIRTLTRPGVIVLTQPLTEPPGGLNNRKMANYNEQYQALCQAILDAEHDLVIASGDAHYGRVAQARNRKGRQLIQVIASPLSNVNGPASFVALKTAPDHPIHMPAQGDDNPVRFDPVQVVPLARRSFLQRYWKDRTREHFQTLTFHRDNGLHLRVQGWPVRDPDRDARPASFNWTDTHWLLT